MQEPAIACRLRHRGGIWVAVGVGALVIAWRWSLRARARQVLGLFDLRGRSSMPVLRDQPGVVRLLCDAHGRATGAGPFAPVKAWGLFVEALAGATAAWSGSPAGETGEAVESEFLLDALRIYRITCAGP